ncbi:MAG: FAD-dependent oxidoreductase [Pseudomonadota bacterium]
MDLGTINQIVIIGGGQAGAQAAISLRSGGYGGSITLVGDEPAAPYQRPPLSKAYLKGELEEERLYFRTKDWYAEEHIALELEVSATAIDRSARTVTLSDGRSLPYDALIIATGSRPRPLPLDGADLSGVFELRSLSDVDRLAADMAPGKTITIVGAGYIGLEAAAVARQMGLNVIVLEMADRVLARVTSPIISRFYSDVHSSQGVDIRTGARLMKLVGSDGTVTAAELEDGSRIDTDLVLVGIGILPNQELVANAGIACENGILVDRDARTSDPRVFAAGDCTARPLVHYGRRGRLESVHNAIEQGKLAAAAILGQARPNEDVPWFWSDQYNLKLQIAGLSTNYDEAVLRGDPDSHRFSVFYLKDGTVIAVDAVNSPPDYMVGKKLIAAAAKLAPATLRDTSVSMKEIAASAAP